MRGRSPRSLIFIALMCPLIMGFTKYRAHEREPFKVPDVRYLGDSAAAQQELNEKYKDDTFVKNCKNYEDWIAFLYKITLGGAECYMTTSFGSCTPKSLDPPAETLLFLSDEGNRLTRLNQAPFSWVDSHEARRGDGMVEVFEKLIAKAGFKKGELRWQDKCFIFAYFICHNTEKGTPLAVVFTSEDILLRQKQFSKDDPKAFGLFKKDSSLKEKNRFVSFLKYPNGGVLRVDIVYGESEKIQFIQWRNVPELAGCYNHEK